MEYVPGPNCSSMIALTAPPRISEAPRIARHTPGTAYNCRRCIKLIVTRTSLPRINVPTLTLHMRSSISSYEITAPLPGGTITHN